MIECVVHYEATGAIGVKDGMVSVLDTGTVEVGGGECLRMEGSPKDGFILAVCTLVDYSIVDVEVMDIFGNVRPLIRTNKREGVVAALARVVVHPFSTWVVIISFLSLSGGVSHSCWVSGTMEEGRRGAVD